MNLYIGLYGCHGVIRFDVKFWEIKKTPEFQVFHGYLIDINRQRKESSEKVWKRVECPSSPSSRSDNECYHSPPRWGVRPWQA